MAAAAAVAAAAGKRHAPGPRVLAWAATALILLSALFAPTAAHAQTERILDFASRITVHPSGRLYVTEKITVVSTGASIRQGIYRDFPTEYRSPRGRRVSVGFRVLWVKRDGKRENYFLRGRANGTRIYIGRRGVLLTPGRYVYEIHYFTDRQIGLFRRHDELYWNVTGNGWGFRIDKARVTIVLPGKTKASQVFAYTGPFGAKGSDWRKVADAPGRVTVETTRGLAPREGLTVAIAWPRGVVTRPSWLDELRVFVEANQWPVATAALLTLLVLSYFLIWLVVGRDPDRGPVIPRFEPPEGLSPGAVRFIARMGYDPRCFSAAIVSMAVKGYLTIEATGDDRFTLERTKAPADGLTTAETKVGEALFGKAAEAGAKVTLGGGASASVRAAVEAHEKQLRDEFQKTYFRLNRWPLVIGVLLSVATLIVAVLSYRRWNDQAVFTGFIVAGFGIAWLILHYLWRAIRLRKWDSVVGWLIIIVIAAAGLLQAWFYIEREMLGLVAALFAVNAGFYYAMRAPTVFGRKVMDQIEGLKLYLGVAEGRRLDEFEGPEETPELFEALFPYALALNVERRWGARFTAALAAAGAPEPGWYAGGEGHRFAASMLDNTFTRALPAAVASSAVAPGGSGGSYSSGSSYSGVSISSSSWSPGSSSGSSGGGYSGGGGGGGGGGGW